MQLHPITLSSIVAGLIVFGVSAISLLFLKDNLSTSVQLSILFYLIMLNFLGMIISYTMELSKRVWKTAILVVMHQICWFISTTSQNLPKESFYNLSNTLFL